MATEETSVPSDTYITLSGVDWATFEGLSERTRGGRIIYDDGELEIMSPSYFHESYLDCLRDLVVALCDRVGVEVLGAGSTTWKNKLKMKGVEADTSFYLDPAKLPVVEALVTREEDITLFPPPDLVIEIDMRRPSPERTAVYAAVGAVEVWEFDGESIRILRLGNDGAYALVPRSGWFPISDGEIARATVDSPRRGVARRRWMREFVTVLD